jgi:predicted nucleic acid-binding protein
MPGRVVDASVLAAIIFEEPEAAAAQRAIGGAPMCAPNLLPYELANTAWKKARRSPD